MKHIILSPGHNSKRKGAKWRGLSEFDLTAPWIANITQQITSMGYCCTNINNTIDHKSKGFGLNAKVSEVNRIARLHDNNTLAVELHFNSAGSAFIEGAETLYYSDPTYADVFHSNFMTSVIPFVKRNRGTKPGRPGLAFLAKTRCPALILEPMFMCQAYNDSNHHNIQESIATALILTANIT